MPLEEKYLSLLNALIPQVTPKALERLSVLFDLVLDTSRKINITSLKSPMEIVLKHFADSLSLVQSPAFCARADAGESACDIGCGGGFPGLPVACLYPHLPLTMIDSTEKKITCLRENAKALELSHITPVWGRGEALAQASGAMRESFAMAFSRAVARLPVLCELCLPFVKKGGVFFALKGLRAEEELAESRHAIALLGGKVAEVIDVSFSAPCVDLSLFSAEEKSIFDEFFLAKRAIIVLEKVKNTPPMYPRAWGKMTKKSL